MLYTNCFCNADHISGILNFITNPFSTSKNLFIEQRVIPPNYLQFRVSSFFKLELTSATKEIVHTKQDNKNNFKKGTIYPEKVPNLISHLVFSENKETEPQESP